MKTAFPHRSALLALLLCFTVGCGATITPLDPDAGDPFLDAGVATDQGSPTDSLRPVDVLRPQDVPPIEPVDVPIPPSHDAGPVTECDPANDGLPCGPVGTGCGGGGGGCAQSFMCSCGRSGRWTCAVSPPRPDCDGGVVDPPGDAGPGPVCALTGVYEASIEGNTLYFTFTADNRWIGSLAPNDPPAVQGTYTLVGDVLTITGETGMSGGGCLVSDRGVYRTVFRAGCQSLDLVRQSDDCNGRGETLDVLEFTRL